MEIQLPTLKLFIIINIFLWLNACGGGGDSDGGTGEFTTDIAALPADAQVTLTHCGGEGERACGLLDIVDRNNSPCDAGLVSRVEDCGCLLPGPWGTCLWRDTCFKCRNGKRTFLADGLIYSKTWERWALTNQRKGLANDQPINWVSRIGAHNAFNAFNDNYPLPSQFYSMTDQLNLGARALAIDVHPVAGRARLCHAESDKDDEGKDDEQCLLQTFLTPGGGMRHFSNGIKEIRNWLNHHPGEIVILELENHVNDKSSAISEPAVRHITDPLEYYLGDKLFRPPADDVQRWPSRRQMLEAGNSVIVLQQFGPISSSAFNTSDYVSRAYRQWIIHDTVNGLTNNPDFLGGCRYYEDHYDPSKSPTPKSVFTIEDEKFVKVGGNQLNPDNDTDPIRFLAVAGAVRCGFGIVSMDYFSREPHFPPRHLGFGRQGAAVWSWKPGDRGNRGDCAMLEVSSGRWVSADCHQTHAYACAPRRAVVNGRVGPRGRVEQRWGITQNQGAFSGGDAACANEFTGDWVFAAPVSGLHHEVLREVLRGQIDSGTPSGVWLNYTDQVREGRWLLPEMDAINASPIADAGPDQLAECGDLVTLDGSSSTDPEGDSLTHEWTGPFGKLAGERIDVQLGGGVHVVELLVTDGQGGSDTDSVQIEIQDSVPPEMNLALSPPMLWPPNHQMIDVTAEVSAEDACDLEPPLVRLESISSNQPDNGQGDGNTSPDISGGEMGSGDLEFALRAERSGKLLDRIYTVTYSASDFAGNVSEQSATVTVPHSLDEGAM